MHDFVIDELGRAYPYGVYDVAANEAWVSVGTDHDMAAFAVRASAAGGRTMGRDLYPAATRLLVTACRAERRRSSSPMAIDDRITGDTLGPWTR